MKMTVFWYVAPCSLVEIYRRFRDAYCLHHQDDKLSGHDETSGLIALMMETGKLFIHTFYDALSSVK
jgi:hypothetical protein